MRSFSISLKTNEWIFQQKLRKLMVNWADSYWALWVNFFRDPKSRSFGPNDGRTIAQKWQKRKCQHLGRLPTFWVICQHFGQYTNRKTLFWVILVWVIGLGYTQSSLQIVTPIGSTIWCHYLEDVTIWSRGLTPLDHLLQRRGCAYR